MRDKIKLDYSDYSIWQTAIIDQKVLKAYILNGGESYEDGKKLCRYSFEC